ncbi:uncharacterized protein BDV14DRAFT_17607 [Aspergillus stella-maris]|uniref:uncharacterized protein n=1 Tax=Aspergillus stella-maris TaxID=1810926 RepID=UPI003CCD06FA
MYYMLALDTPLLLLLLLLDYMAWDISHCLDLGVSALSDLTVGNQKPMISSNCASTADTSTSSDTNSALLLTLPPGMAGRFSVPRNVY